MPQTNTKIGTINKAPLGKPVSKSIANLGKPATPPIKPQTKAKPNTSAEKFSIHSITNNLTNAPSSKPPVPSNAEIMKILNAPTTKPQVVVKKGIVNLESVDQ